MQIPDTLLAAELPPAAKTVLTALWSRAEGEPAWTAPRVTELAARVRLDAVTRLAALFLRAFVAVERGERVLMVLPRHITSDDVVAMLVTWPTLVAVDVTEPCDTAGVEAHEAAWKGTVIA